MFYPQQNSLYPGHAGSAPPPPPVVDTFRNIEHIPITFAAGRAMGYGPGDHTDQAQLKKPTSFTTTIDVSTAAEFVTAIQNAGPNTLIRISDGTKNWGTVDTGQATTANDKGGSIADPNSKIWVEPATPYGVTFNNTKLEIRHSDVALACANIRGSSFVRFGRDRCRATFLDVEVQDVFAQIIFESSGGFTNDDQEADHNALRSYRKVNTGFGGTGIYMPGSGSQFVGAGRRAPRRGWIHHNSFENFRDNTVSQVWVGLTYTPWDPRPDDTFAGFWSPDDNPAHVLVEKNITDDCFGDDEYYTVKCGGAWIRDNLAMNSQLNGHFSGRQTFNCHLTGNYHPDAFQSNALRILGDDNTGQFNFMGGQLAMALHSFRGNGAPYYQPVVRNSYKRNLFIHMDRFLSYSSFIDNRTPLEDSHENEILENFYLGAASQLPYRGEGSPVDTLAKWLAINPNADPANQTYMPETSADNWGVGADINQSFSDETVPGVWDPLHQGWPSADIVHSKPGWWDSHLNFTL